jgi:hypothetical protein
LVSAPARSATILRTLAGTMTSVEAALFAMHTPGVYPAPITGVNHPADVARVEAHALA